jgi:hypothetical protein
MGLTVRELPAAAHDDCVLNLRHPAVKVRLSVLNALTRVNTTYSLASGITKHGWRRIQTRTSFDGWRWLLLTAYSHSNLHNPSRLDRGGGQYLSLPQCSREQLEKEV